MKLTARTRNRLADRQFAGPHRSYPIEDASHAKNAKARASQQYNAGRISAGLKASIFAKANKKLGK